MAFTSVAEKAKNRELINNLNNKRNTTGLLPTSMSLGSAVSQMKKVKVDHQASPPSRKGADVFLVLLQDLNKPPTTEAPGSWRTSLRKAGSSVTLGSDSSQDHSRVPDAGLGMTRSASSPRLSSEADPKANTALTVSTSVLISLFACDRGLFDPCLFNADCYIHTRPLKENG